MFLKSFKIENKNKIKIIKLVSINFVKGLLDDGVSTLRLFEAGFSTNTNSIRLARIYKTRCRPISMYVNLFSP